MVDMLCHCGVPCAWSAVGSGQCAPLLEKSAMYCACVCSKECCGIHNIGSHVIVDSSSCGSPL
jgi:hypothetical protein